MTAKKATSALEKAIRDEKIALGAAKWKRESIKKRISLAKLALKLDCTIAKVRNVLLNPRKKVRVAAEKRKVAAALHQRKNCKDSAARVYRELEIKNISARSVRRMRAPVRKLLRDERAALQKPRGRRTDATQ